MEPDPVTPDPAPHSPSPAASPAKRSAWKQRAASPANGFIPADAPPPPPAVMDADHWPALADAAKTKAPVVPVSDSPKPPPPPPLDSPSSPAAAASSAMANPSNSPRHGSGNHHGRNKPARRGGGNSSSGGGGGDHSPRDRDQRDHHEQRGTERWDHGSSGGGGAGGRGGQRNHSNNGGGGGGRRGGSSSSSGGPGGGGGVTHHGGGYNGGRRRGGFVEGGFYRGPSMGIGPYMRGAPPPPPPLGVAPQFIGPPPPGSHMRAFAGHMMAFPGDMPPPGSPLSPMYYVGGPPPPPEALRGMGFVPPMVGPPAYPYFQPMPEAEPEPELEPEPEHEPEPQGQEKLLKQIEFYFSKDNLCTDVWLRQQMDQEGWVDIPLIATFKKVRAITADLQSADLQYIKETIQSSSMLEVQGDKVRRQNDWHKWVIRRETNPTTMSSSTAAPSPNVNNLTARLGGVALHDPLAGGPSSAMDQNHQEVLLNGSTSMSNNQGPPVAEESTVAEESIGHR